MEGWGNGVDIDQPPTMLDGIKEEENLIGRAGVDSIAFDNGTSRRITNKSVAPPFFRSIRQGVCISNNG